MMKVLPPRQVDEEIKNELKNKYNDLADQRVAFRKKNRYYYQILITYFQFLIPSGKRILELGCADGYILSKLNPSKGIGIDFSSRMIQLAKGKNTNPNIDFIEADIECIEYDEKFDYILMSDILGDLIDIQKVLENLRTACNPETRIIINYHSILWEPVLKFAEKLRLKMPQKQSNWLTKTDIHNFLNLTDFEDVSFEKKFLLPKRIPFFSEFVNKWIAPMPLLNKFCLSNFLIIRKKINPPIKNYSVSIIIPCRNEEGNIQSAVQRIPKFGSSQEIIFIEGHSTDETVKEIKRVIQSFPDKEIKFFIQEGKGKGDAVRLGFSKANKEVLMILDADLTVVPEDLPKFYNAIASDKGELINGCRLVYPMEKEAMRFLNILGNKIFAILFSWLLNQNIRDTLCGTKVLFKKDYENIRRGRDYFGDFDPFGDFDLIFGASKNNLKIVEVPIKYRARFYGKTNISRFRHGWLLLRMTLFAFIKLKVKL